MDKNLKDVIEYLVDENNKNNFISNLSTIALYKPNESTQDSKEIIGKYNKIENQKLKTDFTKLISNLLEEYKKSKQHITHNLFYMISLTKLKECINQKFITNENEFTEQLEIYESHTKKPSMKNKMKGSLKSTKDWIKSKTSKKETPQTVNTSTSTTVNRQENEKTDPDSDNEFSIDELDNMSDGELDLDSDESTDSEEEDSNPTETTKGGKKRKYNKSTMKSGKRIKTSNKIKERLRKVENRKYNVTLKKYKKK